MRQRLVLSVTRSSLVLVLFASLLSQIATSTFANSEVNSKSASHWGYVYKDSDSNFSKALYDKSPRVFGQIEGEIKSEWKVISSDLPREAQVAISHAVEIWSRNYSSVVPITLEVNWSDKLKPDILGSARPGEHFTKFTGAPDPDLWYPSTLANSLAKRDLNPRKSEIFLNINSKQNWHFDVGTSPSLSQYDLVSVILHEIAHGIGFLSNAEYETTFGTGYIFQPTVFDSLVQIPDGRTFAEFCSRSTELGKAMLGPLSWAGTNGTQANENIKISLFSPSTYESGSSIAHIEPSSLASPSENSLLNPSLRSGEVSRKIGNVILGMIEDMRSKRPSRSYLKPPSKPLNLRAIVGDKYVILKFDTQKCRSAGMPESYVVTTYPGGKTKEYRVDPIKINGLTNAKAYRFTVRAKNSQGVSEEVSSASIKPESTAPFNVLDKSSNVEHFATAIFQGKPIVVYGDKNTSTLKMATWMKNRWSLDVIRTGVETGAISICQNGKGKEFSLHVFYGDKQREDLIYSRLQQSKWETEVVDGDGNSYVEYRDNRTGKTSSNVSTSNVCVFASNKLQVFYRDDTKGLLLGAVMISGRWVYELIDGDRDTDNRTTGDVGFNISAANYKGSVYLFYDSILSVNSASIPINGEVRLATRSSVFPEDWKYKTLDGPERGSAVSGYATSLRTKSEKFDLAWFASSGESLPGIDRLALLATSSNSLPKNFKSGKYGDFSKPLTFTKDGIIFGCSQRICQLSTSSGQMRLISGLQTFGREASVLSTPQGELLLTTNKGRLGFISL